MINYTLFIEYLLQKLNKFYVVKSNYILCQNPICDDKTPSATFFKDTGYLKMYNYSIDTKTNLSLKEVCIMTGYLEDYITWLLEQYSIGLYKINKLRQLAKEQYKTQEYKDLRQELSILTTNHYISSKELTQGEYIKSYNISDNIKYKKSKPKVEIIEQSATSEQLEICYKYMIERGLNIDYKIDMSPCVINIGGYTNPCIKFIYSNNYTKYRLINNPHLRYLSKGTLDDFFWVVREQNPILILVEGAIDAITLSYYYKGYDIAGLDSCITAKTFLDLSRHTSIIVLLDKDKFEQSKPIIERELKQYADKLVIRIKCDNENEDFNSLHIKKEEIKIWI